MATQPLILIQARTASTRLPGKINQLIGLKSMLTHVYERCIQVGATRIARAEDYLDIPHEDVLARLTRMYLETQELQTELFSPIVRITADCPMLDTGLLGWMIDEWTRRGEPSILATWSEWDGLDVEVILPAALLHEHATIHLPFSREHVTLGLRASSDAKFVPLYGCGPLRWSVDDQVGLDFVRAVFDQCEHCRTGQPHRMRPEGAGMHPIWDLHDVYGLHPDHKPEPMTCEAHELLMTRVGGPVYESR